MLGRLVPDRMWIYIEGWGEGLSSTGLRTLYMAVFSWKLEGIAVISLILSPFVWNDSRDYLQQSGDACDQLQLAWNIAVLQTKISQPKLLLYHSYTTFSSTDSERRAKHNHIYFLLQHGSTRSRFTEFYLVPTGQNAAGGRSAFCEAMSVSPSREVKLKRTADVLWGQIGGHMRRAVLKKSHKRKGHHFDRRTTTLLGQTKFHLLHHWVSHTGQPDASKKARKQGMKAATFPSSI